MSQFEPQYKCTTLSSSNSLYKQVQKATSYNSANSFLQEKQDFSSCCLSSPTNFTYSMQTRVFFQCILVYHS